VPAEKPGQAEPPASYALQSPSGPGTSSQPPENQAIQPTQAETKPPAQAKEPPSYRSLWPFSPEGMEKRCEVLARLLDDAYREKASDRCSIYAPWIAYLTLETSSESSCGLERVFALATEAITKRNLSGCGYAFLSAYYTHKRIPDRSRSFLEQSLQLSPTDPWVRLVEAVVCERDFRDRARSIGILKDLLDKEPSFHLARYHLARIYVAEEEYTKAREHFLNLEKAFPQQPGFIRMEQSLASIELAPYYSAERARGLLKAGRALSDLMEYPLAGQLCRKVIEDMSSTLPQAEQKSALYDLGRICEITGDRETAYTCYQKALRIDPFYRDARERIGNILKGDAQPS
jgi:tetratricopeptide (TPR) repeat protein